MKFKIGIYCVEVDESFLIYFWDGKVLEVCRNDGVWVKSSLDHIKEADMSMFCSEYIGY